MAVFHRRARTLFLFVLLPFALCFLKVFLVVPLSSLFVVSTPRTLTPRGRTTMHGFKEDFDVWRASLTEDERQLMKRQTMGEYNRKYRKSEEFTKDFPEDKQKALGVILQRYIDNEMEEDLKTRKAEYTNYDGLLSKARGKGDKTHIFFNMTYEVDPIDRDAHRRWLHIPQTQRRYEAQGKWFPPSSPQVDMFMLQNNDTDSNRALCGHLDNLRKLLQRGGSPEFVERGNKFLQKIGQPRVGEEVVVPMRYSVWEIIKKLVALDAEQPCARDQNGRAQHMTDAFFELVQEHEAVVNEIEEDIKYEKEFFRSQLDRTHEKISQADLIVEMYNVFKEHKSLPPLDQDQLAPFRDKPAVQEKKHGDPWGYSDILYRSIAIDGFGDEYLLGVYTTKEEAKRAYDSFYNQYVDLRQKQQEELAMVSKRESARYESELGLGHEKVEQMVATARERYR